MAKHIHIHIHKPTKDAGAWEESKHKRAENGQFGSGGGASSPIKPNPAAAAPSFAKSDAAKKASRLATQSTQGGSGDPHTLHTAASKAHAEAAEEAKARGDRVNAQVHSDYAVTHAAQAKMHTPPAASSAPPAASAEPPAQSPMERDVHKAVTEVMAGWEGVAPETIKAIKERVLTNKKASMGALVDDFPDVSAGKIKRLLEAKKTAAAPHRMSGSSGTQTQAERVNAYLSQRHIGLIRR